jgi:hypothetical protein
MNAFEKHGIAHLSASSLALYRNEPSLWCLKYLYGVKDEAGPAAWRGSAVEAGLDVVLYGGTAHAAFKAAEEVFEAKAQGDLSADVQKQRDVIRDCLARAVIALSDFGTPLARQVKIEHYLDGIEVPLIGFVDYSFEAGDVDLKTTLAMPSVPRIDHQIQVAIYGAARKRKQHLLYVTPKKSRLDGEDAMPDFATAMGTVLRTARAVRAMLSRSADKREASEMFSSSMDSFYWNDALRAEAARVWA